MGTIYAKGGFKRGINMRSVIVSAVMMKVVIWHEQGDQNVTHAGRCG